MKDLNISTGQPGRLVFNLTGGAASLTPVGWIAVTEYPGAKPEPTQMQWVAADHALYLPPMPFGCFFYEVRLGALEVAKGHIDVTPSPFPYDGQEYKTWVVTDGDIVNDVATFNIDAAPGLQGPQGEKGETGEKGDTGASAYQLAAQYGYTGTEADWIAELQGAQAAANSAKASEQSATSSASSATTAQHDAEAAAATAAQHATSAATDAAKLGDAALKSQNNTFTGTNTFNGVIAANGGISYKGFELSEYISAEGYTQQNLAMAALGDTPMELLPASYAEWKAENSAALNTAEKNTLTILLKAAEAEALTMPEGFKKLIVCNTGNFSVVKRAFAGKSLYIYERASTIKDWNIAGITAPVVTFVYPELVNGKNSFYSINASRINLVFPKLRSISSYFLSHDIIGVQEVRFYMPKLAGSGSLFPNNALTADSLLSLAKTLPTVASPQTITIGAAGELQNDIDFQTQLEVVLSEKKWAFSINYI